MNDGWIFASTVVSRGLNSIAFSEIKNTPQTLFNIVMFYFWWQECKKAMEANPDFFSKNKIASDYFYFSNKSNAV